MKSAKLSVFQPNNALNYYSNISAIMKFPLCGLLLKVTLISFCLSFKNIPLGGEELSVEKHIFDWIIFVIKKSPWNFLQLKFVVAEFSSRFYNFSS